MQWSHKSSKYNLYKNLFLGEASGLFERLEIKISEKECLLTDLLVDNKEIHKPLPKR